MNWAEAPYDDALSMQGLGEQPDLEVIWYDVEAVQATLGDEVTGWLLSRAQALRKLSSAPILMIIIGLGEATEQSLGKLISAVPGVRLALPPRCWPGWRTLLTNAFGGCRAPD